MRKILSLFIAIAMLVSLVPTFASAEGVAPIVIDFTKAKLDGGTETKLNAAVSVINSDEFTSVESESSTYKDDQRTHYTTAEGMKLLTAGVSHGSWNSLPWTDANGNAAKAKWTIEFSVPTAGWYTIEFLNGVWASAADFYVYADGQYAGVLNCYDAEKTDTFHSGSDKLENAVYLTPDENGKIKMMFALKAQYTNSPGRALLNKMTLTHIGENNPYTLESTVPETIPYEGSAEFTVCAKNSDGNLFANNGLNADKTARADVVTVAVKEGTSVNVAKLGEENGVYSYKVDATGVGKSTLLITSDAGGNVQTKEVTITVAKPTVAEAVELEFTKTTMNEPYNIAPPGWTLTDKANFEIVWDETTTYNGARFNDSDIFEGGKILWLGTRPYSNLTWINAKSNAQASEIDAMFTVETTMYVPGWYNFSMEGALNKSASEYYVYVNDKYAGLYSFFKDGESGFVSGGTKRLNSLYITPNANNKVRISLCVAATHYSTAYAAPYKMWLTPVEGNNVTFKKFVHNIPETIEKGESADIELYAEMSDGTYRHINGYAHDATVDNTNSIALSVKSGDTIGVENTYDALVYDGIYTGKLTANKAGKTTFTAKVMIDGKEYSEDITVTVPDNAPGVAADETVNVYVVAENGGNIASSDVMVGVVNAVEFGKSVTVSATDTDELKFSHWRNQAGKYISGAKNYTFVANTNTGLIAVFDKKTEVGDFVNVNFFNQYKALLGSKEVAKGTTFAEAKKEIDTTLTGHELAEWSIADNAKINSSTNAVALYNVVSTEYNARFFDGDETTPASVQKGKYGDVVTYTATGDNFSYWVVADGSNRIVSYDKEIAFSLWTTIAVKAVYNEETEVVPTIVLDNQGDASFIAYIVPSGYTPVSAGIIFSKSGTPEINSCFSRAVSENLSTQGQFTARPAEDETIARGYLMFKDMEGNTRVIYAD